MSVGAEWYENSTCILRAKCRSKECVDDLNAVITKGTAHQVKEYVRTNCPSSVLKCDSRGRTPLHIAAACGKTETLDWLIATFSINVDTKDAESGWTALHRAIFYGRLSCAVLLIEHGASMWIRDKEGLTPLDLATLDCAPWVKHLLFTRSTYEMPGALNSADPSEVYTWGANENFTLGQGNPKSCKLPEPVEFFMKKHICVKQIIMCKFHTVFITVSGSAYACGHGEGGRLGTGHQDACLEPQLVVSAPGVCFVMAAAGINHTVFVSDNGQLFTCGLNKHCVLGISSQADRELVPVRVLGPLKTRRVQGCAAGMCHTVAWTDSGALYTFGTNAGQLGHAKGDLYINQPRQVSGVYKEEDTIVCVHACDSATVVATKLGTVYLLQNYVCRRIISKQLDIEKVQVGGGRLDPSALAQVDQRLLTVHKQLKEDSLHVLIRKKSGDVLAWNKTHSTLDRCRFDLPQSFLFKDIALCSHGHTALLITNTGQAFLAKYGNWRAPKPTRKGSQSALFSAANCYESSLDMFDSDSVQEFNLEQISCVFRAHTGALGPKAKGGAVLQCEPRNFLTDVPVVGEETMKDDMQRLWDDVSINDTVHDLVVTATDPCGIKLISVPCHKYILASRSEYFKKLLIQKESKKQMNGEDQDLIVEDSVDQFPKPDQVSELVFENCDPAILRNVLEFAYCETCQILNEGFRLPVLNKCSDSNNVTVHWAGESWSNANNNETSHCDDEYVIGNGDMSAYSIYKENKTQNKKGRKRGAQMTKAPKNFLSEFKVLMKKFGFNRSQVLDSLTAQDKVVHLNKNKQRSRPNALTFDQCKFRDFCDIKLECTDGMILEAHKCVLVARVEFFRSMLLSPWAESKGAPTKVPIPSDVFKYVLDFIYSDSSFALNNSLSVELLCEILAAADQLLLDRLKEIGEMQVASLLTLKNLASVLEFANAFNCTQLKKTCEQFVCQHFPALLNDPHFYSIDYETLEQLEEPYRANITGVHRRVMVPWSKGPDISHIPPEPEEKEKSSSYEYPLSPAGDYEEFAPSSPRKRKFSLSRKSKRKSISKRGSQGGITLSEVLSRNEKDVDLLVDRIASSSIQESAESLEIDSPTSPVEPMEIASLSFDENKNLKHKNIAKTPPVSNPTPTMPATKSKPPVKIQPMRTVASFKDIVAAEEAKQSIVNPISKNEKKHVTSWGTSPQPTPTLVHLPTAPSGAVKSPPNAPTSPWGTVVKSPLDSAGGSGAIAIATRPKKLSQKQRKKLEQEAQKEKPEEAKGAAAASPPTNVWGTASSPPVVARSFWDVMKEQSSSPGLPKQPTVKAPSPTKPLQQVEGPWQNAPVAERKPSDNKVQPLRHNSSFRDIMQSEIHHTERTHRQQNKPMHLIQLEDKAMAELKAHYETTTPHSEGQYFTVERVYDVKDH